jgi:hypothetical protein
MLLSEKLKNILNENHAKIKTMKIFSNAVGVNDKIAFLLTLDKGIRGTCGLILDMFEGHVNTDEKSDNYMIVYASQATVAKELSLTREYVSHCINQMAKNELCPFTKIRRGLNLCNQYIMTAKKKLVELLKEIYKAQEEERKAKNQENKAKEKKQWFGKKDKVDNFNNFEQREYDWDDLEKKLRGLT